MDTHLLVEGHYSNESGEDGREQQLVRVKLIVRPKLKVEGSDERSCNIKECLNVSELLTLMMAKAPKFCSKLMNGSILRKLLENDCRHTLDPNEKTRM